MDVEAKVDFKGSSDDHNQQIVKGKKNKRQRPSFPFGVALTETFSSSSGGERPKELGGRGCSTFSSPATSSEMSTTIEEDEDMANCLIFLAQSGCAKAQMHEETKVKKIIITTTAADTIGKMEEAYECRTCNRSFHSFQALGGHRSSHKKLKILPEEKTVSMEDVERKESERQQQEERFLHKIVSVEKGSYSCSSNNGNKIHECSICGSEFSSGQALGGHMRRHRASSRTSTHLMSKSPVLDQPRNILPLDLNLPAPEEEEEGEDHQRGSEEFQLIKTNQQQHLVFSSLTLVDCHY